MERGQGELGVWGQIELDLGELIGKSLGRLSDPLHYGGKRKYAIDLNCFIYLKG